MVERENKMKKLEGNKRKLPVLPYDIIFQILLLVFPNASLLPLRLVSRQFNAIITDAAFSRLRSPTPKSILIQQGSILGKENDPIKLLLITKQQGNIMHERITIEKPTTGEEIPELICTCDGLLCFLSPDCSEKLRPCTSSHCLPTKSCTHDPMYSSRKVASGFHVYNSLTKKWITTPRFEQPPASGVCGLYKHALTGEYRLLLHVSNGFQVHVLGTDFWREVLHFPTFYSRLQFEHRHRKPPVLMHGNLHFLCNFLSGTGEEEEHYEPGVLVFFTDVEEFKFFSKPCEADVAYPDWHVLCPFETEYGLGYPIINEDRINIWVLRDYKNELWVKQHTFYPQSINRSVDDFWTKHIFLTFSEDGVQWIWRGNWFKGHFMLYDQSSSILKINDSFFAPTSYGSIDCSCCFRSCYWGSLLSIHAF